MGKSSSVKRVNKKGKGRRSRRYSGRGLGKKHTKSSIKSKTYTRDRLYIRTFSSGTVLYNTSDKNMIENIKDYIVNGCDIPYLLYINPQGHINKTRGRKSRKVTLDEFGNETHHVTQLTFNYETWLLTKRLDSGGQQVVGHIQFISFGNDQPIYILSICTRKRQGYGKIILNSLFNHFKHLKTDYLLDSLEEPRRFYNQFGFKSNYELTHEPGTWNNPGELIIEDWQIEKNLNSYRGIIVPPIKYK